MAGSSKAQRLETYEGPAGPAYSTVDDQTWDENRQLTGHAKYCNNNRNVRVLTRNGLDRPGNLDCILKLG